jgi:hypothetical protein
MKQNLKMIPCTKCDGDMPELRKTLYGYNFCIKCSESKNLIKPKHGVPVMMGEGDHTYVETIIMDDDQYQTYMESLSTEKAAAKFAQVKEVSDDDEDDTRNLIGPVIIIDDIKD